ncbi:MAG: hypothetical protein ACTS3R_14505 [Inquilinaceae bacterium]
MNGIDITLRLTAAQVATVGRAAAVVLDHAASRILAHSVLFLGR